MKEEVPILESAEENFDRFFREAEFWLLSAPEKEKELEMRREEILSSSPGGIPQILDDENYGDPTARKAGLLAELAREEAWIKLVYEIEKKGHRDLIELKREYGKGYRSNPVWPRIAARLHYSEGYTKFLWRKIVRETAFLAVLRRISVHQDRIFLLGKNG